MADARAGQRAVAADLVDVDALLAAYTDVKPDLTDPAQRVVSVPRAIVGVVPILLVVTKTALLVSPKHVHHSTSNTRH
jgi:hypothetical protein